MGITAKPRKAKTVSMSELGNRTTTKTKSGMTRYDSDYAQKQRAEQKASQQVQATPKAKAVLNQVAPVESQNVKVIKPEQNSQTPTNTKSEYATPTAATILRRHHPEEAKNVKVSYGKYKVSQNLSPTEYAGYQQSIRETGSPDRYYKDYRKAPPQEQMIVPRGQIKKQEQQQVKYYQEQMKNERPYAPTLAQARLTPKKQSQNSVGLPTLRYDPMTGQSVQGTVYYTESPRESYWSKANKGVRKYTDKALPEMTPKRQEYFEGMAKYTPLGSIGMTDEYKYVRENPLSVPVWYGVGFGTSKLARVGGKVAKSKYVKPLISKGREAFYNTKFMKYATTTKVYQKGSKFARRYSVGDKAMFSGLYLAPKTYEYATASKEQKGQVLASVPFEMGAYRLGAKHGQKSMTGTIKTKYKEYKFKKRIETPQEQLGGKWKYPASSDSSRVVVITNKPFKGKHQHIAGYDVVPEKQLIKAKSDGLKPNPYYTASKERQVYLFNPKRGFENSGYEPLNNILGSGYVPKWHIQQGKLSGQRTLRYSAFNDRETRLLRVHGVDKPMRVQSRGFYQRSLNDYKFPEKPLKESVPFIEQRMTLLKNKKGSYGGNLVTITRTKTKSENIYAPETHFGKTRNKGRIKSKYEGKLKTKNKLYMSGMGGDLFNKGKPKVYEKISPSININTGIGAKSGLKPKLKQFQGQKQSQRQISGQISSTQLITSQKYSNPQPEISIKSTTTGFDPKPSSGKPPTPIGGNLPFFWPGAKYTNPFKAKRKIVKQPKAYTPSAFASGFGIKGKPTKSGIKTGLGLRPIKVK